MREYLLRAIRKQHTQEWYTRARGSMATRQIVSDSALVPTATRHAACASPLGCPPSVVCLIAGIPTFVYEIVRRDAEGHVRCGRPNARHGEEPRADRPRQTPETLVHP
jgi:hypothetical protein